MKHADKLVVVFSPSIPAAFPCNQTPFVDVCLHWCLLICQLQLCACVSVCVWQVQVSRTRCFILHVLMFSCPSVVLSIALALVHVAGCWLQYVRTFICLFVCFAVCVSACLCVCVCAACACSEAHNRSSLSLT